MSASITVRKDQQGHFLLQYRHGLRNEGGFAYGADREQTWRTARNRFAGSVRFLIDLGRRAEGKGR